MPPPLQISITSAKGSLSASDHSDGDDTDGHREDTTLRNRSASSLTLDDDDNLHMEKTAVPSASPREGSPATPRADLDETQTPHQQRQGRIHRRLLEHRAQAESLSGAASPLLVVMSTSAPEDSPAPQTFSKTSLSSSALLVQNLGFAPSFSPSGSLSKASHHADASGSSAHLSTVGRSSFGGGVPCPPPPHATDGEGGQVPLLPRFRRPVELHPTRDALLLPNMITPIAGRIVGVDGPPEQPCHPILENVRDQRPVRTDTRRDGGVTIRRTTLSLVVDGLSSPVVRPPRDGGLGVTLAADAGDELRESGVLSSEGSVTETSLTSETMIGRGRSAGGTGNRHRINEVLPDFLFIGSGRAARDRAYMDSRGISAFLCVARDERLPNDNYQPAQIVEREVLMKHVPLTDSGRTALSQHFDECFAFLRLCLAENRRVLVYCREGKSRSASIVIAYLIRFHNMEYNAALEFLRAAREEVDPNLSFCSQLDSFSEGEKNFRARSAAASGPSPRASPGVNNVVETLPPLPTSEATKPTTTTHIMVNTELLWSPPTSAPPTPHVAGDGPRPMVHVVSPDSALQTPMHVRDDSGVGSSRQQRAALNVSLPLALSESAAASWSGASASSNTHGARHVQLLTHLFNDEE